jgi:hypothetical protein
MILDFGADGRSVKFLSDRRCVMLSRSCTIVPRADRYGHAEKIDLETSIWKSHKLDIAAPHCDKYGHVDPDDPKRKIPVQARVSR